MLHGENECVTEGSPRGWELLQMPRAGVLWGRSRINRPDNQQQRGRSPVTSATQGSTGLAERYAAALFELAEADKALDQVAAELQQLQRMIARLRATWSG